MAAVPATAGQVSFIGAGPGPLGLLTLQGSERLKKADVVFHDSKIPADILSLLPKTAEVVNIGAGWDASNLILNRAANAIMVREALSGKQVVRLRTGDAYTKPSELDHLKRNHVPVEVIPGLTKSIETWRPLPRKRAEEPSIDSNQ
eukprot:Sspe_Gene.113150::Locus_97072_Transcript_1_1_Confidence_1.000_Length_531::g.113150::m.113150